MRNIEPLLKRNKGKVLLAVFPHPDDESFAAGGLLQKVKKYNLKVVLICLTKGGSGLNALKSGDVKKIRQNELSAAIQILKIDDLILLDNPDAKLRNNTESWMKDVKKQIKKLNPAIVLTYDTSGVSGHPDHIATCVAVFKFIKRMQKKPVLLWRAVNANEKRYFKDSGAIEYATEANIFVNLTIAEAVKKLLAMFSHQSQMQDLAFRIKVFSMVLFRQELFHKVDFKKSYPYKFVPFKIEKQS